MSVEHLGPLRTSAGPTSLFHAGQTGPVWRVLQGLVRLDRDAGSVRLPVQLALPGDLIGIEAMCDLPYQFSAQAVTPCVLARVDLDQGQAHGHAQRDALLCEVLLQQQRRSHDMATLRTGSVAQRLAHLLRLLGLPWQGAHGMASHQADAVRGALPALREVAVLVDAKTETVCRALAELLPPRSRKGGPVRQPAVATPAGAARRAAAWWPHGLALGASA
jgi:CRP-like cAMP-binding protein